MTLFPFFSVSQAFGILACLAAACAAQTAIAEQVELLNGDRQEAQLRSIVEDNIAFGVEAGGILETRLSKLYRWGAPAASAPRPTVLLTGGSRLIAAPTWTLDGSLQIEGDRVTIRQMMLDDTVVPRSTVRAILVEAARDHSLYAPAFREAASGEPANDDRIWLTSGDAFSGKVESIISGRLSLLAGGETLEFPLSKVVAIRLATPKSEPFTPSIAIGLRDGGLLLASSATLTEAGMLEVKLTEGPAMVGRRGDAIALVQPLGGQVTYLSELKPIDYRHTPYFNLAWNYGRDKNLFGRPLTCNGKQWLKGLSTHSASRVVYRVAGSAKRFECEIAIDDSALANESLLTSSADGAIFRVLVARGGKFESAFESGIVRPGDAPLPVAVDVAGAQAIALLVDYGETGSTRDHANWLGARLVQP